MITPPASWEIIEDTPAAHTVMRNGTTFQQKHEQQAKEASPASVGDIGTSAPAVRKGEQTIAKATPEELVKVRSGEMSST